MLRTSLVMFLVSFVIGLPHHGREAFRYFLSLFAVI